MRVPDGRELVRFEISAPDGDADLYVKFGDVPTTEDYDCRPFTESSDETCSIGGPTAGTWHVMVRAAVAFDGGALVGDSWSQEDPPPFPVTEIGPGALSPRNPNATGAAVESTLSRDGSE